MISVIYGKDSFRSKKRLLELLSSLEKEGWDVIEKEENYSLSELFKELNQGNILESPKVFVLKDFNFSKKELDFFEFNKKTFLDSKNLLVFYFSRELKKEEEKVFSRAKKERFSLLTKAEVKKWLRDNYFNEAEIEDFVLEKLIFLFWDPQDENSLWRLVSEAEKLISFAGKEKVKIEDVEKICSFDKENPDIFKTIECIGNKDKKNALFLLHHHLKKGDSPLYLFSMISYKFRVLLLIEDLLQKGVSFFEIDRKNRAERSFRRIYPFSIDRTAFESLDFFREAVFFLITPTLAALSKIL